MDYTKDIIYGSYQNSEWKVLNGLDSVQAVLERIKNEINWDGYELWTHGNILNDVDTGDLDLTIMGPVQPNRINSMLEGIVGIGFEMKTYVDVKYSLSNEFYDPVWHKPKEIIYACYKPNITFDGVTFEYGKLVHGLYLKSIKYPMAKTFGKEYKSPVKLI